MVADIKTTPVDRLTRVFEFATSATHRTKRRTAIGLDRWGLLAVRIFFLACNMILGLVDVFDVVDLTDFNCCVDVEMAFW